ncbi:hypothetical protein I3843_15G006900 [Carya illinoinensis]|nr:hypothetical protein I3843_15G006900 [Carya illinoinensis]
MYFQALSVWCPNIDLVCLIRSIHFGYMGLDRVLSEVLQMKLGQPKELEAISNDNKYDKSCGQIDHKRLLKGS